MPAKSKTRKPPRLRSMLLDESVPLAMRRHLLAQVCADDDEEHEALVGELLSAAARGDAKNVYKDKLKQLDDMIEAMKAGPLRCGTFTGIVQRDGLPRRAKVRLPDGSPAVCMLPDDALADELRTGDTVLIEAQGAAVLFREPEVESLGEEARLERRIGSDRVEVRLRDDGGHVLLASHRLLEQLDAGEAEPGDSVLVCPHRQIAFVRVPPADGFAHYEFLERRGVPDVRVERDVGAPPAYLDELTEHVTRELEDPDLGRRYGLYRTRMQLLTGRPGTGKTWSILAMWRRLYEIMSAHTGVPIDELPPRVMNLKPAKVLSKWFGESDKRIERFFDELKQLAGTAWVAPDGARHILPVLVQVEEIDGLARARGDDPIYDRVLTALLQRLDNTDGQLSDKLIVFVFTSNAPAIVDPAFLRRAGGQIERFGGLGERDFRAVLEKRVTDLPFRTGEDTDPDLLRRRAVDEVVGWMFSPNGSDRGQVELSYAGGSSPDVRYRRDFLTGGLVDRAVQEAAAGACTAERAGAEHPGLDARDLMIALDRQVRSIVALLQARNAEHYLTLPEGARLASVRRLAAEVLDPTEVER